MICLSYSGPSAPVRARQILASPCDTFFRAAIREASLPASSTTDWTITIGPNLLFDSSGIRLLVKTLKNYRGPATDIRFRLKLDADAYRDYYSLGADCTDHAMVLPVTASRKATANGSGRDTLDVEFDYCSKRVSYPSALADPALVRTPLALLMEYRGEFDILFANQIALFSALARAVRRSPASWVKALLQQRRGTWARRASLAWSRIHRTADVHPTAVIEGSFIGPGARVGAHCVVRHSHIGDGAQLLDGAKVECSVVGAGSWLMHDLVLFRSHVEDQVFLIHGPYQFSCFHSGSAAFATIMMDYRPDAKPIKAMTLSGVRQYRGRFLRALLKERAKSLGGSLLAPGIIVPSETWLAGDMDAIHRPGQVDLPRERAVSPVSERRAHPWRQHRIETTSERI